MADLKPRFSLGARTVFANEAMASELKIDIDDMPYMKRARAVVKSIWVETLLDQNWILAGQLFPQNGMWIIGELRIFPKETLNHRDIGTWSAELKGVKADVPRVGITMPLVRRVRLGDLRARIGETLELYRQHGASQADVVNDFFPENIRPKKHDPVKQQRGRPSRPDIEYARLAEYYVKRLIRQSRSPVADTASRFGSTPQKIRSELHQARVKKLLTTANHRGVAGGELTPKARELLMNSRKKKGTE